MGDINVFSGPMRSGKSQRICTEYNRQKIAGKNIQMFKPAIDTRAGDKIVETRDGKRIEAIDIENIEELKNYDTDIYFIDEFQFLKGEVDTIHELAKNGKKFYISGLNLTVEKKPFGKMGDLMCVADNVTMLTAICEVCKNDNAVFSFYKGEKNEEILIGDDLYVPVCRKCYDKLLEEKQAENSNN